MSFLPWTTFARIVDRYGGDRRVRHLPCTEHIRALAFAQLTLRESLRDIEACLAAHPAKLYHSGFSAPVRRATLARANERRDWRIQTDFAQRLIARARKLYAGEPLAGELADTVYALDSTTIDLCLSVFPWANFRTAKAAVKLHTLLDLRGSIPSFMHISDGKFHDVNVLDILAPEPGAIYVMDRAYLDFEHLYLMHQTGAFFLTRAKKNLRAHRLYSARKDPQRGIVADQTIALDGPTSQRRYPAHLRRIRYRDPNSGKTLVFLTNRTDLDALTLCDLYKSRWQVELFFKWIKRSSGSSAPRRMPSSRNSGWLSRSTYSSPPFASNSESRPPSTPCSRSCRSCRLNKSLSMKCLQDLNPSLPTRRCRINCLCSPPEVTPLAV